MKIDCSTILIETTILSLLYITKKKIILIHAKKARLTPSDFKFTYVYSSLPPQRVFTRLLNVRSTCLVRSHSRCTENTAAPSRSLRRSEHVSRSYSQFRVFFLPCDVNLIALERVLRAHRTKLRINIFPRVSSKRSHDHYTGFNLGSLKEEQRFSSKW